MFNFSVGEIVQSGLFQLKIVGFTRKPDRNLSILDTTYILGKIIKKNNVSSYIFEVPIKMISKLKEEKNGT